MRRLRLAAVSIFLVSILFCSAVMWSADIKEGDGESRIVSGKAVSETENEGTDKRPVIVIDAGHGGIDAGASGEDGTSEKDINLAIALKLKEAIEKYPVDVVLTREDGEELLEGYDGNGGRKRYDMENRKKIIDENEPALTVSIHLNSFPSDGSVCGAQVFYPKNHDKRTEEQTGEQTSKVFADSVQRSLAEAVSGSETKEALTKNDIFLFQQIDSPIILVECGFLSNAEERENLKTAEYQEKLAEAIWDGINEILCLKKQKKIRSLTVRTTAKKDKKICG